MLPAPGQGALAVQCRADDVDTLSILSAIEHDGTRLAVSAERAFLAGLGGGCSLPVGALAKVTDGLIDLQTVIAAPDGRDMVRLQGSSENPVQLGLMLAREALERGARELLS